MTPDWSRLFPSGNFRWHLGLRPGDARSFFAPTPDHHPTLIAERRHWLAEAPDEYALLTNTGAPLLAEAIAQAHSWGAAPVNDSLTALGVVWEPDFVLLIVNGDAPIVEGGVVCFPTSWALREKLGRTLTDTHEPVPRLNTEVATRVATALQKLPPDTAWERDNWGLVGSPELNRHPLLHRSRLDETTTPQKVWLRVEHQILYKLPQTGGVLFGIRIAHTPFEDLMNEPDARNGLRDALATMPEDATEYKGLTTVRPKILQWISESAL